MIVVLFSVDYNNDRQSHRYDIERTGVGDSRNFIYSFSYWRRNRGGGRQKKKNNDDYFAQVNPHKNEYTRIMCILYKSKKYE